MKKIWKLKFTDELITGIDEIDYAHKQLCEKANLLYDMCTNPDTNKEDLTELIEKTKNMLCEHFEKEIEVFNSSEDKESLNYHKNKHKEFLDYINDLETTPMPILVKALTLNRLIFYYINEHLFEIDKESIKKYIELKDKH